MAKAWAATAAITPQPPITDKTIPTKFIRVLTTVVPVAAATGGPPAATGGPLALALVSEFTEFAEVVDIL